MTRHARDRLICLVTTMLTVAGVGLLPIVITETAHAASDDIGHLDFKYGPGLSPGDGFLDPNLAPTASKPQSKLWFAQGRWWGVLEPPQGMKTTIHAYDESEHSWTNTGVVIDNRDVPTHADVLWDKDKDRLYVASSGRERSEDGIRVTRYRFDANQQKYVEDPGLPTDELTTSGVEAAVIAKDSSQRLWVAYTASAGTGRAVRLLASDVGQTSFPHKFTPSVDGVPLDGTSIHKDDIATVIAHDGMISLAWSNQNADADGNTGFYVAQHPDGANPTAGWTGSRKIFSGPRVADDHISLSSVEGGSGGSVYAAVKTSADDAPSPDTAQGLVWLLALRPDGIWEKHLHSAVKDDMTRPIVLLEPGRSLLHVFATSPVEGGVVYEKTTPLGNISFPSGKGEPFIKLAGHKFVNNATSSKQNVTPASGIMVLATDQTTGYYMHNYVPREAPRANFEFTPESGPAPLDVQFTDTSTGSVTSWAWDFGDGGTSTSRNPTHRFTGKGTYQVTLTVKNAVGDSSKVMPIEVAVPKPVSDFTWAPETGVAPLTVKFTDTSTGPPSTWEWDFGDGEGSTKPNPTHTYEDVAGGDYTVTLTVTNDSGTSRHEEVIQVDRRPDAPMVQLDEPTRTFTRSTLLSVAWHPETPADEVAHYRLRTRRTGPSRRAKWKRTTTTLGAEVASAQVRARRGSTYCITVRAENTAGDAGPWSNEQCTAVPLDDRQLAQRGRWREASGDAHFMGTALVTRARGARVSRVVTGKRVALLVARRPHGGRVVVFRNGRRIKSVSLRASSVKTQRLVTLAAHRRARTARYTVVVTSRRRPVTIDGLAVSRK